MTQRVKLLDLDSDEPPFWASIRAASPRMSNPLRYIRGELGSLMCRKMSMFDCVEEWCPILDHGGEHVAKFCCVCGEDGSRVSISCSEHHKSQGILEAILEEID